ncbi:tricorn protease N-terminal domain-containing protein [Pleomassaria siparia CBS 279.74]|uniref:Tricorn protease N-terminal domain-containing protein n=1 Tax=Pleomassaria siparia CBS 279.74 TaxID=1314801 RepID=A0A6G1KN77_9PLEO|nr:tricorn protease N-terminal domain-containing protein [Pleomassaria siparia CBS 279.74]
MHFSFGLFLGFALEVNLATTQARGLPAEGKKGALLLNRIGPSVSTLWIANADGTDARKLLNDSNFDYHASFSPDGKWITFTSERNGDGNSDLYRVRPDGAGLEKMLATSSFEDEMAISPDGSKCAYVSTTNGFKGNIWIMDLKTGESYNLTNADQVKGVSWSPDGYFKPSWSPDGEWLAFASDRNTGWTGHGNGTGWEHTQELSIYVIRPDGTGFRKLATKDGYCLGSPKWSLDGKRVVFYELTRESTWGAHRPESLNDTTSQIVSVDFATGLDRVEETSGAGLKLSPQYVSDTEIGYLVKSPMEKAGLNYTSSSAVLGAMRSPSWSPDGKLVVYETVGWKIRPMEKKMYSWDADWEYRFTDIFPELSLQGKLTLTLKQLGNSSIAAMNPDGSNSQVVFDTMRSGEVAAAMVEQGLAGAFQPSWSPDGAWIAFGLGSWFQARATYTAWIYRATANGSHFEKLTDGTENSGFPSYSHDGKFLVYRVWGAALGLRVMDIDTKSVRVLTNSSDNLPHYSPDGSRILFTRKMNVTNFDICTIKPDGTDLQVLTSSGANDAHAVWTADGRIMWSSGMYGFRAEAATYDATFQPYGQIMIMESDGSGKKMLTDSMWEDSMPLYLPNSVLG